MRSLLLTVQAERGLVSTSQLIGWAELAGKRAGILKTFANEWESTLGPRACKPQTISRNSFLLAFHAAALLPVNLRGLPEIAFKSTDETGTMLVPNGIGNFLNAQVAARQEISGLLHSLLVEQVAEADARLLLEQMPKVRVAEIEFQRQFIDCAGRLGCDHPKDSVDSLFVWRGN